MEIVNYIIPVAKVDSFKPKGGDYEDRLETIQWAIDKFLPSQKNVHINVIIVEQSLDGEFYFINKLNIKQSMRISYDLVPVRWPVFNKSWLCNIGMKRTTSQHCIIADSDMCAPNDFFSKMLEFVRIQGHKWCFCWSHLYYASYTEKQRLFKGIKISDFDQTRIESPRPRHAEGGMVYFDKSFYVNMGWANEWIQELGGPDNDLAWRAKFISKSYPRFNNMVYHLYHARCPVRNRATRQMNIQILHFMYKHTQETINILKAQEPGMINEPACKERTFYQMRTGRF